ncbi:MAG: hypothetical protein K6U03_02575, partial [Firmicutes bacterium]|nr:hypothetical protein [Bacillota bacterium]
MIEDRENPISESLSIIPNTVIAEESQQVYINGIIKDTWSGVNTNQQIILSINDQELSQGFITALSSNKKCKISGIIQSPLEEGIYDIYISNIKDNAGNTTPSQQIGTLTVKPSPKDQPTNPDESRDLFGST